MKCNECGCEVRDDAKFCPICGANLEEAKAEAVEAEVVEEEAFEETVKAEPKKKQAGCWTKFCKAAKILGYLSFIPFVGFWTGTAGVVFSILGKHSDNEEAQKMRKPAMVCSIVGFCESLTIYYILIFASLFI